ncbi:DUF3606 domain-containing protein [Chitinophaga horti]|uniref:DUF3606 domain-containing protein n=1 Tax=Chitinophaga horti TaxID=2920382 RepID=A0ABY6J7G8_9BACT|nr:DUF3606 domain-containing protein [Chitinophaga horti]UYQ95633.1 DUF3606 domain-containing protein [Chitinophaga horti]
MSDDKDLKGGRDREQVAAGQAYEIEYFQHKLGVSRNDVLEAISKVGNDREALEKYFRDHPPVG